MSKTCWGWGLTPLQMYSRCILQPQPTRQYWIWINLPIDFTLKGLKTQNQNVSGSNDHERLLFIPPELQNSSLTNRCTLVSYQRDLFLRFTRQLKSIELSLAWLIRLFSSWGSCVLYKEVNPWRSNKGKHQDFEYWFSWLEYSTSLANSQLATLQLKAALGWFAHETSYMITGGWNQNQMDWVKTSWIDPLWEKETPDNKSL